jgi:DNA-binding NtrC family response regulator
MASASEAIPSPSPGKTARTDQRMSNTAAPKGRVLVVEDEAYVRDSLLAILTAAGYDAVGAASVIEALAQLARTPVDVVLSDLKMPRVDGLELLRRMQASSPETPVVILTGHGSVGSAVACLRAGASDYLLKPADPEALEVVIERAIEGRALRREVRYLRGARDATAAMVGVSAAWQRVLARVDAAAPTDSTVLLLGESGTGKELLARRIHEGSRRTAASFVRVNCAAVPLEMW